MPGRVPEVPGEVGRVLFSSFHSILNAQKKEILTKQLVMICSPRS